MPTKTGKDLIHTAKKLGKVKGLPRKPQSKTGNPLLDIEKSRSPRVNRQNALRERMENSASEIIDLMTDAIKTGLLGGVRDAEGNMLPPDKISNTMRLDLMKSFLPYVLPQLKSVEYVEQKPADLQPLIINMNDGKASISTDSKTGKTEIELDSGPKEDNKPKEIN
jgi:hypothetical protein